MKRLLLLMVAALVIAPAAMAQVMVVPFKVDKNALVKEIERTNKTLQNEKRALKGQPWFDRGEAMYAAASAIASQIYAGMLQEELMSKLGKDAPQPVDKTVTFGSTSRTFQVVSLPEADIYLTDGVVQFWIEKVTVYEGATEEAIKSFKKAAELDKKLQPKVVEALKRIADIYKISANGLYNTGENMPAAEYFLKSYDLLKDPMIGMIDTASVFNAGYLYISNEEWDKGIEVYEDAVANDVWSEGSIPYFLSWAYLQKGPDYYPKAKEILVKGLELFPDNENISEGLINYYSLAGDDFSEIAGLLEEAVKKDPSKMIFWNGLGQAYLKMGDRPKTIEFFREFVSAFPNDFGANYYLGDKLMEEGEALLEKAQKDESLSQAQKDELVSRAMDLFREGYPVSEKAYLLRPEENAAVQRVTRILYHLQDEPGMGPIFQKYNKIYEALN